MSMVKTHRKLSGVLCGMVFGIALMLSFGFFSAKAADPAASEITVGDVDYDQLTMKVYKNGNTIVYFSADARKTWTEAEGESGTDPTYGSYILLDISWINPKADASVYFKGNKCTTAVEVVFPKANTAFKVKVNNISLDFEFTGNEDATDFMWRKASDYNWQKVSFAKDSDSYKKFLKEVSTFRFKGCKLVFICDQTVGTGVNSMGHRPSNEAAVSIQKMANAPSVKVNVKKMNINTKKNMEYYDEAKKAWVPCTQNMTLADIAPEILYAASKEGTTVRIKIRTAATEKKGYSKTTILTIPGQTAAPAFGEKANVKMEFSDGKLVLSFLDAASDKQIDYCVVAKGTTFNQATAKWKTVKSVKQVKLTEKNAPAGSMIYIRFTGVAENIKKNISLKLPSYYDSYEVPTWPKTDEKKKN